MDRSEHSTRSTSVRLHNGDCRRLLSLSRREGSVVERMGMVRWASEPMEILSVLDGVRSSSEREKEKRKRGDIH